MSELKKNCSPDLIIYIVGSKADLHAYRQVTSDLARLSLHTWFPPPRPPTPPPPPPPSTFSYIRPRFTSFTSIRSVPVSTTTSSTPRSPLSPSPERDCHVDSGASALQRSSTTAFTRPRAKSGGLLLPRANSTGAAVRPGYSRFGPRTGGWNELPDGSSNSLNDEEEADESDDQEWGLHKGMELFEVSAKDDFGIQHLFDSLIAAIITRKDSIERENEMKRRDSVFLSPVATPAWAAQADEEEAREKARAAAGVSWSCCQT